MEGGSETAASIGTSADATIGEESASGSGESGGDGDGDGDGDVTGAGDGDGDGEGGDTVECSVVGGQPVECEDGIDNDGDGAIDLNDLECTSPCDDSELTLLTSLPGQNMDCKSDCYWDTDSGVGNDDCEWNLACDPLNPGLDTGCDNGGMPSASCDPPNTPQSDTCINTCSQITPNGCDCFGCCEVLVTDGMGGFTSQNVYLGNEEHPCGLENIEDCTTCTLQENCANPCVAEECEICFGQTEPIDPDCVEVGCVGGIACETSADCEENYFCSTGCCVPIDIPPAG